MPKASIGSIKLLLPFKNNRDNLPLNLLRVKVKHVNFQIDNRKTMLKKKMIKKINQPIPILIIKISYLKLVLILPHGRPLISSTTSFSRVNIFRNTEGKSY
jgi:hypothetical protein